MRQNLYYTFIETIHNIVKHSDADQVEIRIDNSDSVFQIFVADNDDGIKPDVLKNGNGHRNMKMSAGRIGVTLEIVPTVGCAFK